MHPERVNRLRRALVAISVLAAVWSALAALTGGFMVHVFGVPVSSRNPQNPALLAIASGLAAWVLPMPDRRQTMRATWLRWSGHFISLYSRWPRWADGAAAIALVGSWLQVSVWASGRPLWLDEQMIALNVRDRSLGDLAGSLWLGQSAPLGWLALERLVVLTLGTGERAVRLVPVLFGGLTLVVAVWAGRRWTSAFGATVFVLLCAFSPWLSHYPLELKHYSADTFWALLLPTLAVWAIEANESTRRMRRAGIWWSAAAIGHWFANGALLVTPGCAVALLVIVWRRTGWRAALTFSIVGVVWLASFGLHYFISVRHTLENPFLRSYWAGGLPPASEGLAATGRWLGSQLEPLAANPGGTELWVTFWLLAICGFAFARGSLGVVLATVPLSGFVLSAVRVAPLQDRLSLWIVPALYFGIAIFSDGSVTLARRAYVRRSRSHPLLAVVVAFVGLGLCSDIVSRGLDGLRSRRATESNHGLYDRAAVQWLEERRQPGDALITTHLGLPAVWWYGPVRLSSADQAGGHQPDGSAILEATHASGSDCDGDRLRIMLAGQRRVLVYSGFPDQPTGFDELLLRSLSRLGDITAYRAFGEISRVAVIDLGASPTSDVEPGAIQPDAGQGATTARLDGCVTAQLARRW